MIFSHKSDELKYVDPTYNFHFQMKFCPQHTEHQIVQNSLIYAIKQFLQSKNKQTKLSEKQIRAESINKPHLARLYVQMSSTFVMQNKRFRSVVFILFIIFWIFMLNPSIIVNCLFLQIFTQPSTVYRAGSVCCLSVSVSVCV